MATVAEAVHSPELERRVDVPGLPRIDDYPAAVAAEQLEEVAGEARVRHQRAVVLGAAAVDARVGLRDVEVVEHVGCERLAAVGPLPAAVFTEVAPAVVGAVEPPRHARREDELVMVGVRVVRRVSLGVPLRRAPPGGTAVGREVQVDAAAHDVIRIERMYRDRVVVGHLLFGPDLWAGHVGPGGAAVGRPEHAQHAVRADARGLGHERVDDIGIRWRDRDRRPADAIG